MVYGRDSAWRNRAPGPHRNTARQAMDGLRTEVCGQQKQSNDPHNNQHNPQYANYWAPLTRKRHIPPHSAQPRHTDHWALRTRKRHQQEHRPQRPTERSDPTQHAKGRTGDRRVKELQPDGLSHRGAFGACRLRPSAAVGPRGGGRAVRDTALRPRWRGPSTKPTWGHPLFDVKLSQKSNERLWI